MPDFLYRAVWGFDTNVRHFWLAHAWSAVKTFRLVRLRLQSMPKASESRSFMSLPNEVLDMIETHLVKSVMDDTLVDVPENKCDCGEYLWQDFLDGSATEDAYREFCNEKGLSSQPDGDRISGAEHLRPFQESDQYKRLWETYQEEHREQCEDLEAGDRYWEEIAEFIHHTIERNKPPVGSVNVSEHSR